MHIAQPDLEEGVCDEATKWGVNQDRKTFADSVKELDLISRATEAAEVSPVSSSGRTVRMPQLNPATIDWTRRYQSTWCPCPMAN